MSSQQPNPAQNSFQPRRAKRAVLRLDGSLAEGFLVALEISDRALICEAIGELPAAPALLTALEDWRSVYRRSLSYARTARIALESLTVEAGLPAQRQSCRDLSHSLEHLFQQWLAHSGFQEIEQRLRESLNPEDAVEILLRTRDRHLYHLPWHRWGFIERYPRAEVVLSMPSERIETAFQPYPKARILAILGDGRGIDTETDRRILEKTPKAEVVFLVEPSRQVLYEHLWEAAWDILFFAGHSRTESQQGFIQINAEEQLSIADLRYAMRKAIQRGLQLAIFNSCDGLGLAHELESLHIPQFIVMREPVPDRVAQEFLKQFLGAFSAGKSLHGAVRQGREWLQGLESEFPCASWLPVLFQNPAMDALHWRDFGPGYSEPVRRSSVWRLRGILAMGLLSGVLVMGGRSMGVMEQAELWTYDRMVQMQFALAKPSPQEQALKVRVIGVTRKDTQRYGQGMKEENKISDRALAMLITKINRYRPKVIGLDIFRDTPQPNAAGYKQLLESLQSANMVLSCQVGEDDQDGRQAIPSIAPPKLSTPTQIGYADSLVNDGDGRIRRYITTMEMRAGADCLTPWSFARQLAQQARPTVVDPILAHDFGGYQGDPEQFGAGQLMINYHPSNRYINSYSLQDIMNLNQEGELQQLFQNNIVLIGYDLGNGEDQHSTPIGRQNGVMIHTYALRQLLKQTPEIRTLPQSVEYAGILTAAVLGGILGRRRMMVMALGVIGIYLLGYGAYTQAIWVPVLPMALAVLVTHVLLWIVMRRRIMYR